MKLSNKFLLVISIIILLLHPNLNPTLADEHLFDNQIRGDNYLNLYSGIDNSLLTTFGISEFVGKSGDSTLNALDQAFGIITFLQLYDIFGDTEFLDRAKLLADIIYTNFQDPRFQLIANYYDSDTKIVSNYRNAIDNFLIAWAFDDLVDRVDQTDSVLVRDLKTRAESIAFNLENFLNGDFFVESFRVDNPALSAKFNVYVNLMLSFIILESASDLFNPYSDTVIKIFDLINSSITSPEGGVYSLYIDGYRDDIITLRNTALFSTLGYQLFSKTNNTAYKQTAEKSLDFIRLNFADLGVTRGYFETLEAGKLVQLSKSLFSHSLLLLTFLKSATLGNLNSQLDLRSMWEMINEYFRSKNTNELFYSTIDRSGRPASQKSRSLDNLLMIFTLSRLSTIANVGFDSKVDFRDKAEFHITHIIPDKVTSTLTIKFEDEVVASVNVTGDGKISTSELKVGLDRPKSDEKTQPFSIELLTLNLAFDLASGSFVIQAKVGIELSPSAITLYSAVLIIFLVLLINELSKTKINKSIKR